MDKNKPWRMVRGKHLLPFGLNNTGDDDPNVYKECNKKINEKEARSANIGRDRVCVFEKAGP